MFSFSSVLFVFQTFWSCPTWSLVICSAERNTFFSWYPGYLLNESWVAFLMIVKPWIGNQCLTRSCYFFITSTNHIFFWGSDDTASGWCRKLSQVKPLGWSLSEAPEEPPWCSEESGLGQEWDGGSPRGFWEYFTKLNGDQNIAHRKTAQDI